MLMDRLAHGEDEYLTFSQVFSMISANPLNRISASPQEIWRANLLGEGPEYLTGVLLGQLALMRTT